MDCYEAFIAGDVCVAAAAFGGGCAGGVGVVGVAVAGGVGGCGDFGSEEIEEVFSIIVVDYFLFLIDFVGVHQSVCSGSPGPRRGAAFV